MSRGDSEDAREAKAVEGSLGTVVYLSIDAGGDVIEAELCADMRYKVQSIFKAFALILPSRLMAIKNY